MTVEKCFDFYLSSFVKFLNCFLSFATKEISRGENLSAKGTNTVSVLFHSRVRSPLPLESLDRSAKIEISRREGTKIPLCSCYLGFISSLFSLYLG